MTRVRDNIQVIWKEYTELVDIPQDIVQLQHVLLPGLDKVLRPKVLRKLLTSANVLYEPSATEVFHFMVADAG